MNNFVYKAIKVDKDSPSYRLYVLIQEDGVTADFIIEKATTTTTVTELTYYVSNESIETVSAAWTARASKTYAVKTNFKGVFVDY
jgi:hypothetical protein